MQQGVAVGNVVRAWVKRKRVGTLWELKRHELFLNTQLIGSRMKDGEKEVVAPIAKHSPLSIVTDFLTDSKQFSCYKLLLNASNTLCAGTYFKREGIFCELLVGVARSRPH